MLEEHIAAASSVMAEKGMTTEEGAPGDVKQLVSAWPLGMVCVPATRIPMTGTGCSSPMRNPFAPRPQEQGRQRKERSNE